ncbi:Dabb family protein [Mesorhizobium sp.]|uniref:Dabb family protein n=1 Tax=Mesorhizobium sp. TaxID=1871066 RepID=UPI00257C52FE|nr:Dabb family protein [Mesorhizobium sp.]
MDQVATQKGQRERVKHVVMWNLVPTADGQKAAAVEAVKSRFEALLGAIPGLLHIEVGVDFSGVDYACDVVLYSEFESAEALEAYANHPAHLKIRDELQGVRIARYQVDYVSTEDPPP